MQIHTQLDRTTYVLDQAEVKAAFKDYLVRKDPGIPARNDVEIALSQTGLIVVTIRNLEPVNEQR